MDCSGSLALSVELEEGIESLCCSRDFLSLSNIESSVAAHRVDAEEECLPTGLTPCVRMRKHSWELFWTPMHY